MATSPARGDRARLVSLARFAMVMAVLFAIATLPHSSLFLIERIDVVGAHALDANTVRTLAGLRLGQRLFAVDAAVVAARLRMHPRIKTADMRLRAPHGVVITITERQPVLALAVGERFALIDADLMVVEMTAAPGDLIQVFDRASRLGPMKPGVAAPSAAPRAALEAAAALPEDLRADVIRVIVLSGPEFSFVMKSGLELRAGGLPGLSTRLAQVPAVLEALQAKHIAVTSIDLRYAGSIVVKPAAGGEAR